MLMNCRIVSLTTCKKAWTMSLPDWLQSKSISLMFRLPTGVFRLPADEIFMEKMFRSMRSVALTSALLAGAPGGASAYTPDNHERSVRQGAAQCEISHAIKIGNADLDAMIQGVLEPDKFSPSHFQMLRQRFEPNSYGTQRSVAPDRIAAQSFHGSPSPTRPVYTDSEDDQKKKRQTIPVPAAELLPNRFALDVYAYDTNQGVRNKMLLNASQFLCISFAHQDDAQSARKFGNMLHMIGDTYSASHVQRSEPEHAADNCGTEKIEWHFSMDLVSWKLHRPADQQHQDWRFRCLVKHASDLMKLWVNGRAAVRKETHQAAKLKRANEQVAPTLRLLCGRIFKEDPEVLRRPAGGAAAGYSIASGTDNWEFFWRLIRQQAADKPIQPVGLTGPEEAIAFRQRVNDELKTKGGPAHFWYPSRNVEDFCQALDRQDQLPAALQCTAQEIDWAMSGSKEVESLWIPARTQP